MTAYPPALCAAVAARAGIDAAAAAVEINRLIFAVRRPIPAAAVRKLWSESGVLARAWAVAGDPGAPFAQRWHCRAAYDAIEGGAFADFSPDDPANLARMQVYFARLLAAGPEGDRVLTPEIVAATLALATVEVVGAELLGRPLDESDVINMRAEIG